MGNVVLMHELEPLKEFQGVVIHSHYFTLPRTAGGSIPQLLQWCRNSDHYKVEVEA